MDMSGLLMVYEIIVTNVTIGFSNGVSWEQKVNVLSCEQHKNIYNFSILSKINVLLKRNSTYR